MMMMIVAIIMNYEDDEDLVVVDKEEDVGGDYDNYGDGGDQVRLLQDGQAEGNFAKVLDPRVSGAQRASCCSQHLQALWRRLKPDRVHRPGLNPSRPGGPGALGVRPTQGFHRGDRGGQCGCCSDCTSRVQVCTTLDQP